MRASIVIITDEVDSQDHIQRTVHVWNVGEGYDSSLGAIVDEISDAFGDPQGVTEQLT